MRTLIMTAVLALGISGAALADPMASAYGNTCFTQTDPAPPAGMGANCSPTAEKKVGDSWTAPGPNGSTLTVSIVAGR